MSDPTQIGAGQPLPQAPIPLTPPPPNAPTPLMQQPQSRNPQVDPTAEPIPVPKQPASVGTPPQVPKQPTPPVDTTGGTGTGQTIFEPGQNPLNTFDLGHLQGLAD